MAGSVDTADYVGFTFFVGCMAMMAASAFFFLSMNSHDNKWRTSILVSGLITFIAAVHYWYMREYWLQIKLPLLSSDMLTGYYCSSYVC